MAADAMSAAWASAELRLLGSELRATEDGVAALSARAARGAKAAADVLILDEELSTARAELERRRHKEFTSKEPLRNAKRTYQLARRRCNVHCIVQPAAF